ncbi:isocitrate lyase/phosphoenolpyruvate mutase family protein [Chitinophaga agrisoli]|uniref:Isocitrate lyase/phosphoenolpyruvate mutase family protein n=1 Tax=Chitinophaga agrisoli TaxID=2607653 RepID=A0A5B2VVW9_9BACT|nr:isocitrate lyase/phosphoenolpyruvate mutase family protein [Chitinophaga agrisoli]KAA2242728.1 isocitrate lyase/phosphoenolpyruvate mutase family protein [Chitinophaga agrisoli]
MQDLVTQFRALHQQDSPLILPNVWDAGGAVIATSLGAKAVATTSAGVAWSLGYPDGHTLPTNLQVELTKRIARVITVPLSVDMENGYSADPEIVAQNVIEIIRAGASGINLEDGRDSPEIVIAKIKAIREATAKEGLDVFINLRTDIYLQQLVPSDKAVETTIKRGLAYKEAGADGLFVPGLAASGDIKAITQALAMPVNVMAWPGLPAALKLAELGVKRLSAGSGISQIVWQGVADMTKDFLANGDSASLTKENMSYGDLQALFSRIS